MINLSDLMSIIQSQFVARDHNVKIISACITLRAGSRQLTVTCNADSINLKLDEDLDPNSGGDFTIESP